MHRRRVRANSIIQIGRNSAFPRHFAICRSIHPIQFQILYLDNSFTYRNGLELLRLENDTSENIEQMVVEHHHNYENHISRGDFYIWNQMTGNPQRLRYELFNIYLRNEHKVFPVAVIDTMSGVPTPEFLVIPQNIQRNVNMNRVIYNSEISEDPYYLARFILNRDNFIEPHYFEDRSPPEAPPFLQALDYEHYFENRRRALERDNPEDMFVGAGAGPYDSESRRRRIARNNGIEIPDTPRTRIRQRRHSREEAQQQTQVQPQQVQQQTQRQPSELQAFTIQALIQHAVNEKVNCPISMNPIQVSSASVTLCQHIFDKESIQRWFEDHTTCPVCRQETRICN